jgi:hypothetical protein
VKAHQLVDVRDRREAAFDGPNRLGIGEAADADRDIGSKKRPGSLDDRPLDGRYGLGQSAFS